MAHPSAVVEADECQAAPCGDRRRGCWPVATRQITPAAVVPLATEGSRLVSGEHLGVGYNARPGRHLTSLFHPPYGNSVCDSWDRAGHRERRSRPAHAHPLVVPLFGRTETSSVAPRLPKGPATHCLRSFQFDAAHSPRRYPEGRLPRASLPKRGVIRGLRRRCRPRRRQGRSPPCSARRRRRTESRAQPSPILPCHPAHESRSGSAGFAPLPRPG